MEPEEGFQRNAFTVAANILTAIGFALLLTGAYALRGRPVTWREGLLWGLGGFVAFTAAPGLGLPPELPGMPVAELAARQTWWIATAAATAMGLCLLALRPAIWTAVLGLGLIALPHLIGAPLAPESHSEIPAALSHRFVVVVTLTSLLFWACSASPPASRSCASRAGKHRHSIMSEVGATLHSTMVAGFGKQSPRPADISLYP